MGCITSGSAAAVTALATCTVVRYLRTDSVFMAHLPRKPSLQLLWSTPRPLCGPVPLTPVQGISLLGILVVTTVRANSLTDRNTQLKALIAEKCQTYPV